MARPPSDARARLLTVAARQVRRAGAGSVTLDTVARETGCAKGLVTYHFGGRDQLLAAAAAELFGGREADWRRALHAPAIEDAIQQVSRLLAAEAQDGFWRAWVSLSAESTKLTVQTVNNHWTGFVDLITATLSEILEDHGLEATVSREELGRLLAAGFQGLGLQLSAGGKPESVEGAHAALWAAALSLTRPAGRR